MRRFNSFCTCSVPTVSVVVVVTITADFVVGVIRDFEVALETW